MVFCLIFPAWHPDLSGCYRPEYYHKPSARGGENNRVTRLEPVIIMASETSYDKTNPGYDAGGSN